VQNNNNNNNNNNNTLKTIIKCHSATDSLIGILNMPINELEILWHFIRDFKKMALKIVFHSLFFPYSVRQGLMATGSAIQKHYCHKLAHKLLDSVNCYADGIFTSSANLFGSKLLCDAPVISSNRLNK